jgi:CDGSH-type Zn-finger protein
MKKCVCNKSQLYPYCDGSHNKIITENSKGTPFIRVSKEEKEE